MADKLVPSVDDTGAVRRFRDMGDGTWAEVVATSAGSAGAAGYPTGATPVAASGTGANANISATLPAAVGKTTYLTGLQMTGGGATAASAFNLTISGVVGGTISYFFVAPAGVNQVMIPPFIQNFNPPLPAAAPNTPIVVTMNAVGAGNIAQNVSAQGFQL